MGFVDVGVVDIRFPANGLTWAKTAIPRIPSADRPAGVNLVSLTPVLIRHHRLMP